MGLTLNGNAELGASHAYDAGGRIMHKTEGSTSETMQYGPVGPEHAVSQASGGTAGTLTYDGNGNLCAYRGDGGAQTCSPPTGNSTYAYDAENRLTSRTYTYDAGGTLVMRALYDGSYTLYIGGIYEEVHAANGTVTGVTKYYQMNGRTVAVRNTTDASGMQTGTLDYVLHDQLGSAVGTLAVDGSIASTASYWPYGALRNFTVGLVLETDKLYTGQRMESGDAALGLYNYNARFYSTTLGAFVSADTSANDGVNRFAYVRGNPLSSIDPTGLDVLVVCGFTDNCAHGRASSAFRNAVEEYWIRTGRAFGSYSLDEAFALLQYVAIVGNWDTGRTLAAFGAGFVNTALDSSELDSHRENLHINIQDYVDRVTDAVAHDSAVDFLVGFSMGGATIADWMNEQRGSAGAYVYPSLLSQIKSVLLIEPAFDVAGWGFFGNPHLDARDFPGIRIVTQNGDSGAAVGGFVANSQLNYVDRECDTSFVAHCEHQGTQALDVDIAVGWCVPEGPSPQGVICRDGNYHAR